MPKAELKPTPNSAPKKAALIESLSGETLRDSLIISVSAVVNEASCTNLALGQCLILR